MFLPSAQAPNFVWKTTDFPAAQKGYKWIIVLQVLLSKCFFSFHETAMGRGCILVLLVERYGSTDSVVPQVLVTATTQLLLWRDRRNGRKQISNSRSAPESDEVLASRLAEVETKGQSQGSIDAAERGKAV
jgi:hypothetical protein